MNRGHSGDSLNTGLDGIKRSSSDSSLSTDFTSDDEANADNLSFINGQLSQTAPEKLNKQFIDNHISHRDTTKQAPKSILKQFNKRLIDDCYADGFYRCPGSSQQLSDAPQTIGANAYSELMPRVKQNLNAYLDFQTDLIFDDYRHQKALIDGSDNNTSIVDDSENIEDLSSEEHLNFLIQGFTPSTSSISRSNRRMNNGASRMCSRLLECRDLIEAIEFVETNRELINSLTLIITQEAPAFRNYDFNNYHIDHSVKESFNPDFWLDREPIVTTADGNCQYHAVSLSLTGCETYTPEVRLATAVAVIDNREWFDSVLKLVDRGTVLDLVYTIARSYSWGDETTLKAIAVAINRRIFLYTCNIGKKDYEMVKSLSKEELVDAFREKKYRGGTGIHAYADPLIRVNTNNYIMLFHKSEHFIAVLPTCQQLTMFEPYNPIVPVFN